MNCPSCGSANLPEAAYCANCGIPLETQPGESQSVVYCTSCGSGNSSEAGSCTSCGVPLHAPPSGRERYAATEVPSEATSVEYMGFWIRFLASLIDSVILFIVALILGAITAGASPYIQLIINILYYVLFTGLRGQTPGKMVVGIQVLTREGEVPGIGRAILREVIGKFVSGIVLLLGYIWVAFDPNKQGWHDKIAGTYVIRRSRR